MSFLEFSRYLWWIACFYETSLGKDVNNYKKITCAETHNYRIKNWILKWLRNVLCSLIIDIYNLFRIFRLFISSIYTPRVEDLPGLCYWMYSPRFCLSLWEVTLPKSKVLTNSWKLIFLRVVWHFGFEYYNNIHVLIGKVFSITLNLETK